ncbi:Tetratricopeptide repeat-containing protein [Paenibacillus sp. CF095]|uniref:glycosyltransferase n=1 Tax=Paenibacillus sp. CF095 TaxID=1881033 RepID=UPI00088FFE24|nr:glycosyltransferase [Paenibacillus sp. CF095]SDD33758.1 Tetratricopeptide repeat-containing protein [Paenibacillus sp. CF095]
MKNRLLGIHMIVQNEEHHLPRCLDSLKHIGTECFITDTGSSDRTPEIGRTYGATVLHARWQDDFAHARNISLPLASTEWVLSLDADEYVAQGLEELLNYLPKVHKSISRLRITIENRYGEGVEERVISQPVRLFRAHQGYRYAGRVHEQLVRHSPCKLAQDEVADTNKSESNTDEESVLIETEPLAPLCLIHDGYLASTIAQEHKPRRNLKLIERELADEPAQPFHLYNLGVTYCQLGQIEQAIEVFRESLHLTELLAPYRPTLVRDYAKTLVGSARYDEAHAILAVERQRYPSYADLHLLYGETLEQQGLEERAYQSYARATDCRKGMDRVGQSDGGGKFDAQYVTEAGSDSYRAYTAMARLAQKRGFLNESAHLYGLALDSMFTYAPAWVGLADVMQQSGETDENIAEALLARCRGFEESGHGDSIRGEMPHSYAVMNEDHLVHVIYVLAGCGAYEQALKMLDADVRTARIHVADRIHWMLCANKVSEALQLAEEHWNVGGAHEVNLLGEHRMDWALACWANGLRLSEAFLATTLPQEKNVWKVMDRLLDQLTKEPRSRKSASQEQKLMQWGPQAEMVAEKVVQQAIKTGQLILAEQLHELRAMMMRDHWDTAVTLRREFASLLYRQGYTMVAANILIQCMTESELDAEGLFWLGETLYAKGHNDQALSLFEQALEQKPDMRQARAGAAVCYMRLAMEAIRQEMVRSSSSGVLDAQYTALEQRLRTTEGIPWRTLFQAKERRNQLASGTNFPMHDREG